MDYSDYYEARKIIEKIMSKDLLGPVDNSEIICDEWPLDYYILGKLYPQGYGIDDTNKVSSEDCGELDDEIGISLSNSRNPSSFGISFSLNDTAKSFTVKPSAAKYVLMDKHSACEELGLDPNGKKKNAHFWKRNDLVCCPITISVDELKVGKTASVKNNDYDIRVLLHKSYDDGSKTITVSMINSAHAAEGNDYEYNNEHALFQPRLSIESDNENAFGDVRRNVHFNTNEEIAELELLYRFKHSYASGHGCAVNWDCDQDNHPTRLYTDFLPTYESLQMKPSTAFQGEILSMRYLSESKRDEIVAGLIDLSEEYKRWIKDRNEEINKLPDEYKKAAQRNTQKCIETSNTIRKSIEALDDDDVFRAFQLANRAMFLQRKRTGKYKFDNDIKWYPFQLAFFLQELISFANPCSDERKKVDLLWFPTGGGKTEAYLGIAAFVIFLRRIRHQESGSGVTVLMRYTLRLLTFQQFERASALICACESIRKQENIPGGEIGIGLWAGKGLTPNYINIADDILKGRELDKEEKSNPVQVKKCPWCGEEITAENYECDLTSKRMLIKCGNPKCEFHSGLPIYLIDEEIYEHCPSFIVATIDKFAQVALNQDTAALFGAHVYRPPELIIQDELHLISGPLGTITGLYEAAFKKLCEYEGISPKVVASTATIRNAKEQIKALYAADYTQFPPQGLVITNSFFAEESSREERPARLYLGCMGIGTSPTTMMIRVMASLLYASRYLISKGYDEDVIDSFWTITGYFNTLRELGGAIIRVVDDIQDRFTYLHNKFEKLFPLTNTSKRYERYKELTSREESENIGTVIQNELTQRYREDNSETPYDFLLSSNMISVGVDVGRLGAMVVVGQPKTTAEYIQATSRVGRETPGLVIATYNQSKSRDRSHYESFHQYHESFYKFVESTSLTPFSDRARDRALQALYVIMCRNMIPALSGNHDAIHYQKNMPELNTIREYILSYVNQVDPREYDHVAEDLDEIETIWEEKCSRRNKLSYRYTKYCDPDQVLFDPDYYEDSRFRVLNTMRSVETTVTVFTDEKLR